MCIKKHFNGIKGELRRADPLDENTIDQWDSSCRQKPYCQCCWGQQNYSNAQYKVVIFAIFAVEYEAIRPRWRAKLRVSENLLENQAVTVGRCHATANEKAALAASLAEPTEAAVGRGEFESSRSSRESANVAGPPGGEPAEQQPSEDYLKTKNDPNEQKPSFQEQQTTYLRDVSDGGLPRARRASHGAVEGNAGYAQIQHAKGKL